MNEERNGLRHFVDALYCIRRLQASCTSLDSDEDWEDEIDLITFARYCAAQNQNLHLDKIAQDHDGKMCKRLGEGLSERNSI